MASNSFLFRKKKILTLLLFSSLQWVCYSCSYFDLAKETLSKGDILGTIRVYEQAIAENSVENCLAYYLLGNIYSTTGKYNDAIRQYNNYINHHCQKANKVDVILKEIRANIHLGHLEKAHTILKSNQKINQADSIKKFNELSDEIKKLENDMNLLEKHLKNNQCQSVLQLVDSLSNVLTHSNRLLKYKIQCYDILKDTEGLTSALKVYITMNPDDIDAMLKLSQTYYNGCNLEESLTYIRACLRSDQGNTNCLKHMRNVKNAKRVVDNMNNHLKNKNYKDIVTQSTILLKLSKSESGVPCLELKSLYMNCHAQSRLKNNPKEALKLCSDAIEKAKNDVHIQADILHSRGLIYIDLDMLDKAKEDITKSLSLVESKEAQEAMDIVERLLKKRNKRDYYKILGVPKNAKDTDIKAAYRKLAVLYHPDKARTDHEKETFEKKFIDINSAREVLLDKEKREKFDRGIDPLEAEENMHDNMNSFRNRRTGGQTFFSSDHGFFDFGGGHFTFNF